MSKRKKVQLAERDGGWFCFYCKRPLDPNHGEMVELWYCPLPWKQFTGHQAHLPLLGMQRHEFWVDAPCIDHVIPRSRGGSNDLSNLVLCCRSCNSSKGTAHYFRRSHYLTGEVSL
jgi:hypothetical protein